MLLFGFDTGIVRFRISHHPDAALANAEKWAARPPVPVYAIDDETAIKSDRRHHRSGLRRALEVVYPLILSAPAKRRVMVDAFLI
jgi:hypothetical protein